MTKTERQKRRRALDPERYRIWRRAHRAEDPQADRNKQRRCRLGPNAVEHYDQQLKKQKGLCAVCSCEMTTPYQDHSHICCKPVAGRLRKSCGRCLRGLLCPRCNSTLWKGLEILLIDNPRLTVRDPWLRKAHSYVLYWKEKHDNQKV